MFPDVSKYQMSYRMADPEGDKGLYVGPVDDRGKANGTGRLEYEDNRGIFIGTFSHGSMMDGVYFEESKIMYTMKDGKWTAVVDAELVTNFSPRRWDTPLVEERGRSREIKRLVELLFSKEEELKVLRDKYQRAQVDIDLQSLEIGRLRKKLETTPQQDLETQTELVATNPDEHKRIIKHDVKSELAMAKKVDGSEENSRSVSPSDIDWDIVVQEDFDAFSK